LITSLIVKYRKNDNTALFSISASFPAVTAGFAVEILALEAEVLLSKGECLFFVNGAAPDL